MPTYDYPEDLRYTTEHEWVRLAEDGTARVGITAFAQGALGDIVYVSLPEQGSDVGGGDSCGEVESTKSVSDVYAPVSGRVVAVNEALDGSPELVNADPYGRGWLFELQVADLSAVDELLDAAGYRAQVE